MANKEWEISWVNVIVCVYYSIFKKKKSVIYIFVCN